jgi:hypothetical protein
MRLLIDIAIAFILALAVGIGSAWWAIDRGYIFGAVSVGPWTAWPESGSADADPYAEATLARTGEVPLGAGEGLAFTAAADSAGQRLRGDCVYRIAGQTPPARLWTLTAYDSAGHLMENPAVRTTFHSREILRHPDGTFAIAVSAEAMPGNWLPIGRTAAFRLALRLYDSPLAAGIQVGTVAMPRIDRVRCR